MSWEEHPEYGGPPLKWWHLLLMPGTVGAIVFVMWLLIRLN